MAEPTIQLGGGNWAGKSDNLLGYYKEGERFYKQDFTFSRASTGTYTDKDGYIQEMPYNLLTYSNDFSNVSWNGSNYITADYAISPDGTQNASRCLFTGANQVLSKLTTLQTGVSCSATIYIKGTSGETISLAAGGVDTMQTLNGEWQRIETNKTSINSTFVLNTFSGATARDFLIYGAQLEQGTSAKTYFPTTTRLNMPRVDYKDNSNGSLILEKQSTNLNTYSEDIPQNYVSTEMSDTFGYSSSPNGLQTSTRLQLSNVGSSRYVHTLTGIVSSGTAYNFSCYYKGTQGETAYMHALVVGGTAITKEITFTGEWQRESLNFTAGSSSNYVYIVDSRQGGNASDFEVWGAQVEAGNYATSIIPTAGSTVTRLADASATTGLSDVIGQAEGTMFIDIDFNHSSTGTNEYLMQIYKGSGLRILIYRDGASGGLSYYFIQAATLFNYTSSISSNGVHKLAFAYKSGDSVFYIDGVQVDTDATTFSAFTSLSELHIGANFNPTQVEIGDYKYNQAQLYNTRLTNTELATLTTL